MQHAVRHFAAKVAATKPLFNLYATYCLILCNFQVKSSVEIGVAKDFKNFLGGT